jgi:hypothetical protein
MILEDDGVHQYALLLRGRRPALGDTVRIPVLAPISSRQGVLRLVLESTADTVTVGGATRSVWRWQLLAPSGERRTVWADSQDRIFRLRIPARSFDAVRDEIPR